MESEMNFFYTNAVEIGVSPYDVNLKFIRQGTPEDVQQGQAVKPQKMAELVVAMSPSHAKAMLAGFYKSILEYERSVGKIAIDASAQKIFDETFSAFQKK